MKQLSLTLLLFCLPLLSCAQKNELPIGSDTDGVYKITAPIPVVKKILNNALKESKITADLVNFHIKDGIIENSDDKYYYLIGSNSDESVKIVTVLHRGSDNIFRAEMSFQLPDVPRKTCTCSGSCTKGCDPKMYRDKEGDIEWRCSSCTQPKKTCNKSVTDS